MNEQVKNIVISVQRSFSNDASIRVIYAGGSKATKSKAIARYFMRHSNTTIRIVGHRLFSQTARRFRRTNNIRIIFPHLEYQSLLKKKESNKSYRYYRCLIESLYRRAIKIVHFVSICVRKKEIMQFRKRNVIQFFQVFMIEP